MCCSAVFIHSIGFSHLHCLRLARPRDPTRRRSSAYGASSRRCTPRRAVGTATAPARVSAASSATSCRSQHRPPAPRLQGRLPALLCARPAAARPLPALLCVCRLLPAHALPIAANPLGQPGRWGTARFLGGVPAEAGRPRGGTAIRGAQCVLCRPLGADGRRGAGGQVHVNLHGPASPRIAE